MHLAPLFSWTEANNMTPTWMKAARHHRRGKPSTKLLEDDHPVFVDTLTKRKTITDTILCSTTTHTNIMLSSYYHNVAYAWLSSMVLQLNNSFALVVLYGSMFSLMLQYWSVCYITSYNLSAYLYIKTTQAIFDRESCCYCLG